ncbi:MAG TPA: hypothetical protein DEB70_11960, partial [Planctomycetaceae bacterium]|nr:hypothetical protein [Planctomycetaceae bacterium]
MIDRIRRFQIDGALVVKIYFPKETVLHHISTILLVGIGTVIAINTVFAQEEGSFSKTIFRDDFNRKEKIEGKENPG